MSIPMKCPKHGCVMTETITDDVFCGVCRVAERDARIAELERENQSMRADWKAICDAAESMPAGTVEFQLRQRIAHLEEALREAIEWNWMQDSVPTEVIDQVATALGVPATEL